MFVIQLISNENSKLSIQTLKLQSQHKEKEKQKEASKKMGEKRSDAESILLKPKANQNRFWKFVSGLKQVRKEA